MNLLRVIPTPIVRKVSMSLLKGQKHSPTILFVGGVAGVVATTIVASRATLKAGAVLDHAKSRVAEADLMVQNPASEYSEEDRNKDVIYFYTQASVDILKLYTPALVIGALSIGMLTGSHQILTKRNAALTAAYASLDRAFAEYRDRVREHYGDKHQLADDVFRHGHENRPIDVEDENGNPIVEWQSRVGNNRPSMYAIFFDETNENFKRIPEMNRIFLDAIERQANFRLHQRGHLFLNELYDMMGAPRTRAGAIVGWIDGEGDSFVDLGIFRDGESRALRDFVNGHEAAVLIDPNVDGVIWDHI